jgi:hypothetical protein
MARAGWSLCRRQPISGPSCSMPRIPPSE